MTLLRRLPCAGLVALALLGAPTAVAAQDYSAMGMISSGADFDVHTVNLPSGAQVDARLICLETVPGNNDRPLDPVLSVFFPSNPDPVPDTNNADVFNDDGFGSDDDPLLGVDCNAFDSSRVIFITPEPGMYRFRADGFGSSTGPYLLEIYITEGVPTLPFPFYLTLAGLTAALGAFALRRYKSSMPALS